MDIAALSMVMSQAKAQTAVGVSVLKMAMDTGKQNAAQMTDMMGNIAVDPNLGTNLDISA